MRRLQGDVRRGVNTIVVRAGGTSAIHIDVIEGHPLPILLVRGWSDSDGELAIALEMADGRTQSPAYIFRVPRPDVVNAKLSRNRYAGFVAEFQLSAKPAFVCAGQERVAIGNAQLYATVEPHYAELLSTKRILRREDVYGFGPPQDANEEVVAVAAALPSNVLDFGCGNGDLVDQLRAQGKDAFGIEIDRAPIRNGLKPGAAPFVKLYQGGLPLPYEDGAFASTVSSEVLEHIDGVEPYAAEIARITRQSLFVTVPDMISIPLSHLTGTVPWHLLESTHVNFFTAKSITALFSAWFRPVRYYRFGNSEVNGRFIPGSVGVLFERL